MWAYYLEMFTLIKMSQLDGIFLGMHLKGPQQIPKKKITYYGQPINSLNARK